MLGLQGKLIAFTATIVILTIAAGYIYCKGGQDCEARHAIAQLKHNEKLRKTDDKIKRSAPSDANKPAAIEWLRQHTRRE